MSQRGLLASSEVSQHAREAVESRAYWIVLADAQTGAKLGKLESRFYEQGGKNDRFYLGKFPFVPADMLAIMWLFPKSEYPSENISAALAECNAAETVSEIDSRLSSGSDIIVLMDFPWERGPEVIDLLHRAVIGNFCQWAGISP